MSMKQRKPIEVGIISFKNLKKQFSPFNLKEDKEVNSIIMKKF
jgi:hypothetical protein